MFGACFPSRCCDMGLVGRFPTGFVRSRSKELGRLQHLRPASWGLRGLGAGSVAQLASAATRGYYLFCDNGAEAWQSALKLWCSHDCADSQQRLMMAAGQLWSHSPVLHVVLGPVRRCCAGSVACVAVAGARYCIKSWSCDHAYL